MLVCSFLLLVILADMTFPGRDNKTLWVTWLQVLWSGFISKRINEAYVELKRAINQASQPVQLMQSLNTYGSRTKDINSRTAETL